MLPLASRAAPDRPPCPRGPSVGVVGDEARLGDGHAAEHAAEGRVLEGGVHERGRHGLRGLAAHLQSCILVGQHREVPRAHAEDAHHEGDERVVLREPGHDDVGEEEHGQGEPRHGPPHELPRLP
ncbi:unnamed protein product, partial [Heterosigma akashiwo]